MTAGVPQSAGQQPVTPDDLAPGWLQRAAALGWRILVTIALGLVLLEIAMLIGTVSVAILIGFIVAATFAPLVRGLRARGWDRTKAAAAVSLVALLVLTLTLVLLGVAFLPYLADTVAAIQAGGQQVREWADASAFPQAVGFVLGRLTDAIQSFIAGAAADLVGPIASLVTALILGGFLTFFLLQDGDRAWGWMTAPIQGWRGDAITQSGQVAVARVGGYLRGTAILAASDAISDFIFLVLLGVPLAGPLSVLVFLGGFIPYLGGFIATTILCLVTLSSVGPTAVVILLVLITIMNIIQGNFMAPVIYGATLDVHPALVLVALPAGAALFGIIGLFAALPVVAFTLAIVPAIIHALDLPPEAPRPDSLVPVWLDRMAQWSWRSLVVLGLLAVFVAAATRIPTVVLPIIIGVVLAATLEPGAAILRRRGWKRGLAALAMTAGTVLGIGFIVVVTVIAMIDPLQEILDDAAVGASQGILGSIGLVDVVRAFGSGLLQNVAAFVSELAAAGVVLLLSALLTFYFLRDGESLWRRVVARANDAVRAPVAEAGSKAAGVLSGYMIGTGVISAFGALTTMILMIILGLPLAFPIAVLAFFLGFIPYVGSFIATGLAFLVTIAVGSSTDVLIMGIFTIVFNIAQGNFVAPLVYGRAVSLHPAIILLAIPAGSAIAGMIGMFLVVPFLGVVAVTWRTVLRVMSGSGRGDEAHPAPGSGVGAEARSAGSPADGPGPEEGLVGAAPA